MSEQKSILMIEDDAFLRKLYRDKLDREDLRFIEATNGVEGINKMKSETPDLVILDILLPVKGGFEMLQEKNADDELKDIPVVVLSNLGQDIDIEEGKRLGVKEYFVKSEISFSAVVDKIKEILESS